MLVLLMSVAYIDLVDTSELRSVSRAKPLAGSDGVHAVDFVTGYSHHVEATDRSGALDGVSVTQVFSNHCSSPSAYAFNPPIIFPFLLPVVIHRSTDLAPGPFGCHRKTCRWIDRWIGLGAKW